MSYFSCVQAASKRSEKKGQMPLGEQFGKLKVMQTYPYRTATETAIIGNSFQSNGLSANEVELLV